MKKKPVLSKKIWSSEEEFQHYWNLLMRMKVKNLRFFPGKISKRKWASLQAMWHFRGEDWKTRGGGRYYKQKEIVKEGEIVEVKREIIPQKKPDISLLKNMPYKEYLQTKHWKKLRALTIIRANHKCQLCNSDGKLNVHHRSYENRGDFEREKRDLICLCELCHQKFHGIF